MLVSVERVVPRPLQTQADRRPRLQLAHHRHAVAAEAEVPAPGELLADAGEPREARRELGAVDLGGASQGRGGGLHAGVEDGAGACDDAVAALGAVYAAHRRAHGVRGRHAPAGGAAQGAERVGVERLGHGGVEEDVHEPAPGEAEALQVAVGGEDRLGGRDAAVGGGERPGRAVALKGEHGRPLGDRHAVAAQALAQAPHVAGGLEHHRARGEEARDVVEAPRQLPHPLRVQALAGLADAGEVPGVAPVERVAGLAGGAVDLAGGVEEGGGHGVGGCRVAGEGDGAAVERHRGAVVAAPRVVVRGQLVRQVNHEARVAPRGALCEPPRLQHGHPDLGVRLAEPAGGRQAREAAPHHRDVHRDVAGERHGGGLARQDRGPGRDPGVPGQAPGAARLRRQGPRRR